MKKTEAKRIIETIKNEGSTNYFSGNLRLNDMYEMFRYRYGFGDAETNLILAALVACGCKFKQGE